MVSVAEVRKHNKKDDCWVIIHGKAYDVTEFLPEHPGGSRIILRFAGKDATKKFDPIHPPDTLDKYLPESKHKGPVEMTESAATTAPQSAAPSTTAPQSAAPPTPQASPSEPSEPEDPEEAEERERLRWVAAKPPLSQCYNLLDFEHVASKTLSKTAWAYYSSGADDEITLRENRTAFQRIWFRPKVLVDVSSIDLSTTMLGTKTSAPFYVTATALGKLGHPDGEKVLTRASAAHDIIQMIPTLASCSFDEIVDAAIDKQTQWLQLYVNMDREITKKIVQHAEERGVKGLWITVDAPQLGRREKDMRSKFEAEAADVQEDDDGIDRSQGAARAISSFIDPALCWDDIKWFKSITKMPIVLKGIQRGEDAVKAAESGVAGILLSNHGGRQLEFARSAIEVLIEVMRDLRARNLQDKLEVYVDGGVRRGTDILKALCLGAKGVGIGRPFLYAMGSYGDAGVIRAMQLLKDELEMNMRLIGARSISELDESLVEVRGVSTRNVPRDILFDTVYQPLEAPAFKQSKL